MTEPKSLHGSEYRELQLTDGGSSVSDVTEGVRTTTGVCGRERVERDAGAVQTWLEQTKAGEEAEEGTPFAVSEHGEVVDVLSDWSEEMAPLWEAAGEYLSGNADWESFSMLDYGRLI